MDELKRTGHARVHTDDRIYRLAVPVLKRYLKFGHFTSRSYRDGKEMYKNA